MAGKQRIGRTRARFEVTPPDFRRAPKTIDNAREAGLGSGPKWLPEGPAAGPRLRGSPRLETGHARRGSAALHLARWAWLAVRTESGTKLWVYSNQMDLRVGLCGFTMAMEDYALHFPVVEIQHTFYEPPRNEVMRRWLARTPPTLEYTMKVWQLVTHAANSPTYRKMKTPLAAGAEPGFFRDSAAVQEGWRRSRECAHLLGATAMLFQCPASFTPAPENVDRVRRFFERIARPSARLLWEPRGAEWVKKRDLAISLCRDLELVHVVDPFVTPPERGHPVYWRLHGIGGARHSHTDAQLHQLRDLLLRADPPVPAYVMFNNLPRVGDAKRFVRVLG